MLYRKNFMFSTQRRRVLRCCVPESMKKVFLVLKNMNLTLSHSNEHVNPLLTVLAPFSIPQKLTNSLKTNKSRKFKMKIVPKSNAGSKEKKISQYLGCLSRSIMFNVVSLAFLQRTTFRARKMTELLVTSHIFIVLP